jgi:hypothetical protein
VRRRQGDHVRRVLRDEDSEGPDTGPSRSLEERLGASRP